MTTRPEPLPEPPGTTSWGHSGTGFPPLRGTGPDPTPETKEKT
jgi:hypothetical protein